MGVLYLASRLRVWLLLTVAILQTLITGRHKHGLLITIFVIVSRGLTQSMRPSLSDRYQGIFIRKLCRLAVFDVITVVSGHPRLLILIIIVPIDTPPFVASDGPRINLRGCIFKLSKLPKFVVRREIPIYIIASFIV